MVQNELSIEQRSSLLDKEVLAYIKRGYQIVSRTPTTAQLVKKRKFNVLWALFLTLLAVLPVFIYLLVLMVDRGQSVYLEVDTQGKVNVVKR